MRLEPGIITDEEFAGMQAAKTFFGSKTKAPNHDPYCTRKHPQVLFAFWQEDFDGEKRPYWHVMNDGPSHHSTLSMLGLRQWGIL